VKQIKSLFILALLLPFALAMHAQDATPEVTPDTSAYTWIQVASGFNSPLYVTHAGDDTGRLFVVEQDGYIFVLDENGSYDDFDPFLDISALLSPDVFQGGYTERGLLGLAFHPDFATNGLFFINHTDLNGDTIIARYHVKPDDPNHADIASRTEILKIPQPYYDHNGGVLAFGPDGYLYIGVGDGGSLGDDPGAAAQDLSTLLGKILRIDVNADTYTIPENNPFVGVEGAQPEIWAYGLRNPWRISFDRATGDLYIGEVGQLSYEEIDFQPADSPGGENYGWYDFEGLHPYHRETPPENMTAPITEYPHTEGCAVTGGYVYRGEALPELQGAYFFGDYCTGKIWTLVRDSAGEWQLQPFMQTSATISSFGEDQAGELYMVDYKGDVLRLSPAS
jgi:glucose/arabinose dehydrogenase